MTTSEYAGAPPTAPPPPASPEDITAEPAAAPTRRRGARSLTTKIAVGVVTLVIILVGVIGTTTYVALRRSLLSTLDSQLATTAAQNAGFFSRCLQTAQPDGREGNVCESGPQASKEWVGAILPGGGLVVFHTDNSYGNYSNDIRPLRLSNERIASILRDPNQRFSVEVDGRLLRAAAAPSQSGYIIVTGLSTTDVSRTLRSVVLVELIAGLAAVGLAIGASTWGVRFSLRRLRRVTVTAQEVADELSPTGAGLDRRVPDDEPDTEVGQLATSFNTMLAAVETQFAARIESEHRLRQFLADASHELRTPLTSIRGYAELARMQRAVGDDASDNLDRIESEGTRMSRLVEDLLMLARGDAVATDGDGPSAVRESIDVAGLLDDVVSSTRAAFPDRPVELQVEALADVVGDRDQLLRAVRNLVTNACVHTEAGRPIRVHGLTRSGGVVITVVDGGPGLPPEQAAHVFERFWRADKARTRARGGTGLGMSIVATIVRAHGGSVRFESTVEGGSTVTLWLPAAS